MVRRPLVAACAAALVTSSGCVSLLPKQARHDSPSRPLSADGKATTASATAAEEAAAQPPVAATAMPKAASVESPPVEDPAIALQAIRRKSEAYARSMEVLLAEKSAGAPARGSAVQWLNPQKFQLSLGESASEPVDAEEDGSTAPVIAGKGESIGKSHPLPNRDPATTGPAETQTFSDASNLPLELADVSDRTAVASVTPANGQSQPAMALNSTSSPLNETALLAKLSKRVKENPRDVASHLEYQMLMYLLDEQVPNLSAIAPLPQEDRELVTAILDGLSNLRSTLRRDGNLMTAEKIRPVVELADRLKTSAELVVPTLALATRVEGFGRYETMESRLIAGKESPAIVYCEIENFSSQINAEQLWETNLSMEVALFSEMGPQVFTDAPATISDTSRSRRHDFFVRKLIKFPSNLTIGRYVLKVTMIDSQSNRVAETSLPLQVVAQ